MIVKTIKVDQLARVEGEGALKVVARDGVVQSAELNIFEPPRFFEAFLRDRLYAACGGAGANRYEEPRLFTDLLDARRIMRRRHRTFDEREIVRAFDRGARRFEKMRDLDFTGDL